MSAIADFNQPEDKPKTRITYLKKFASLLMAIALCFYLTACGGESNSANKAKATVKQIETTNIIEVSPPAEIQRLSRLLDQYEPQVSIISPKPEEVLNDTKVNVKFDFKKPSKLSESVVKGSSSKPVASTKPAKEQVLSEGSELKARFKKLANIL